MEILIPLAAFFFGFIIGSIFMFILSAKKKRRKEEKSRVEPIYYDLGRLLK